MSQPAVSWAYGVTTCAARLSTLLPRTLASLKGAGFPEPRLFVDGTLSGCEHFGLPCTYRVPALRPFGNWYASLLELYLRSPGADRFALFQDDVLACRNLRAYLEACPYPAKGYLCLYCAPSQEQACPRVDGKPRPGWFEGGTLTRSTSLQLGRGALGLVFSREAVLVLLRSESMVLRPLEPVRGWRCVDGGVVTAMNKSGWREWVHWPSLLCHTGDVSTMDKRKTSQGDSEHFPPYRWPERLRGCGWQADFDPMALLEKV